MSRSETRELPNQADRARGTLVDALPVTERRIRIAEVSTSLLEGGSGTPSLVLLHGPGEFAASWARVLPDLIASHHVVAPDLPGHGGSFVDSGTLNAVQTIRWLDALIDEVCPTPPVLVGRTLGGAIAARFAVEHPRKVARLVLVDTFGLVDFQPTAEFGAALHEYLDQPDTDTYDKLMHQCSFDAERLRDGLGDLWTPLQTYSVARLRDRVGRAAVEAAMHAFGAAIPSSTLARISVPTSLIWGRHDLATALSAAESASRRHGWPLHVIDRAADDPTLDAPEEFVGLLHTLLEDGR